MAARQVALACEAANLESLKIKLENNVRDIYHHLTLLSKYVYETNEREVGGYHRTYVENHHVACTVDEILSAGQWRWAPLGSVAVALSLSHRLRGVASRE